MPAPRRATITARTLRTDQWWIQPLLTAVALVLFIGTPVGAGLPIAPSVLRWPRSSRERR